MKPFAAIAAVLLLGVNAAQAALLSEQQARSKAVNVLMGDPYGRTVDEVAKKIKEASAI